MRLACRNWNSSSLDIDARLPLSIEQSAWAAVKPNGVYNNKYATDGSVSLAKMRGNSGAEGGDGGGGGHRGGGRGGGEGPSGAQLMMRGPPPHALASMTKSVAQVLRLMSAKALVRCSASSYAAKSAVVSTLGMVNCICIVVPCRTEHSSATVLGSALWPYTGTSTSVAKRLHRLVSSGIAALERMMVAETAQLLDGEGGDAGDGRGRGGGGLRLG